MTIFYKNLRRFHRQKSRLLPRALTVGNPYEHPRQSNVASVGEIGMILIMSGGIILSEPNMPTKNTESVHGLRRFLDGILYGMSRVIGFICLAIGTMMAVGAFQKGRSAGQWLVCLALVIGGIIILSVGSLLEENSNAKATTNDNDAEQIVGCEQRERVSHHDWSGDA
jgi:uncharacterized membrane protein HdeD (DUF308 family)